MKLYDVEIPRLNNEYLLKGKKQCIFVKKMYLVFAALFGIGSALFLFLAGAPFYFFIGGPIGVGSLFWLVSKYFEKGIHECDAEIAKRIASKKLSQSYVDEVFRPKTKEEKKESRITWIFFGTIIAVILFIVVGCTISANQDDPFDDVFNKDPNNWSDSEKEYVNDLFDWMKENN